jgi:hypothetical protein
MSIYKRRLQILPTWIEVNNVYGYDKIADVGDSGGPWFTFTDGTGRGYSTNRWRRDTQVFCRGENGSNFASRI